MKYITTLLQICAVLVGLVSAWYWWKSANTGPVEIPAADKPQGGGNGDLIMDWGGDKMMHIRTFAQSQLNSKAALWTGASVLLQLLALISSIVSGVATNDL